MSMTVFEFAVTFVISWWMLLFMVLPFKAAANEQAEAYEYHAAPKLTYLKPKLLVTTLLAVLVTFLISLVVKHGIVDAWLPYRF
jgi:predicted secreted protein